MCFTNDDCVQLWVTLAKWFTTHFWNRNDINESPADFTRYNNTEEFDFVVEKLAIKHVPVCLFATAYDIDICRNGRNDIITQSTSNQRPTSTTPGLLSNENSSPTMGTKRIRFDNHDETIEDTHSHTLPFAPGTGSTIVNLELINNLTAFHPHLKESDRPPKDTVQSSNTTNSQRSFAEQLSEYASKNQQQLNNTCDTIVDIKLTSNPGPSKE